MACQGFIQYTKLIAASSELCLIIYQEMHRFPYGHLWLTGRNGVMTPQIERCLSNILPKKTYTNTQQRENIMSAHITKLAKNKKEEGNRTWKDRFSTFFGKSFKEHMLCVSEVLSILV